MINYELKKIKAFVFDIDGVLSCETITMFPTGEPMRTVNIKDGYALQWAVKMNYKIAIITGAKTDAIFVRYNGLGIEDVYAGASIKTEAFAHFLNKHDLKAEEVLYMGDDIPDFEVMKLCGLPCCPADAATEIKELSNYISPFKGGQGCGRDVIEQVMRAQDKWMSHADAFGW